MPLRYICMIRFSNWSFTTASLSEWRTSKLVRRRLLLNAAQGGDPGAELLANHGRRQPGCAAPDHQEIRRQLRVLEQGRAGLERGDAKQNHHGEERSADQAK